MLVHCRSRDFFLLFAEAQRAFGTRVFFDVSYLGDVSAVLIVSPDEFCVMREDATLLLRVQLRDVTRVAVNDEVNDGHCCVYVSDTEVPHTVRASIAAAAVCNALSRRAAPALVWDDISRARAIEELKTHWFPLLTADWAARVRIALASHPLFTISREFPVRLTHSSSFPSLLTPCSFSVRYATRKYGEDQMLTALRTLWHGLHDCQREDIHLV
jgi:hypothetical protein